MTSKEFIKYFTLPGYHNHKMRALSAIEEGMPEVYAGIADESFTYEELLNIIVENLPKYDYFWDLEENI